MKSEISDLLPQLPQKVGLTIKGDGAWIKCPYHADGNERTPSLKINLSPGKYQNLWKCFGCHEKGHWNRLADHFGLPLLSGDFESVGGDRLNFRSKLRNRTTDGERDDEDRFDWPTTKDWRGIPGKILNRAGCKVTKTRSALDLPKLIIPAMQHGEEVGYIEALIRDPKRDSKGRKVEKSYINSPGNWSSSTLLGFDLANLDYFRGEPLWVVEGPRDFLHLLSAHLRVVAILGSHFDETKMELMRLLNPPLVIVGTDKDEAGDKAAKAILDVSSDFLTCVRVNWPEGEDPADQPRGKLKKITRQIKRKYNLCP